MTKLDEPHTRILRTCTRKYWLSLHMSLISISPPKWKENNTVQVPWLLPPNWSRKWLQAIMTLQGREPTCAEAKSQLGEQQAGQKDDWGQEIEKIETGRWSHLGLTESRLVVGQSNTERKLSEQEWPKKKMKPKTWQGQIVHIHIMQVEWSRGCMLGLFVALWTCSLYLATFICIPQPGCLIVPLSL